MATAILETLGAVTADGTLILPGEGPSFQILRLS